MNQHLLCDVSHIIAPISYYCQPGDPVERSWGFFTPWQSCSKERGGVHFSKHGSFIYDVCDLVKNDIDNDFQASPLEAAEIFEKLTSSDAGERDGAAAVVGLTDLNEQLKMSFARLRR